MSDEKWDQILKTGIHYDANGNKVEISKEDLHKIIEKFDPEKREIPLVIGHPKINSPAWGWVNKLRVNSDILEAQYKDIVNEIKPILALKQYKKKSVSLYPDKSLRHVGLLGATQPAIPGLKDFQFMDNDKSILIEFNKEGNMPDNDNSLINSLKHQLAEKEKELKEKETQLTDNKNKYEKLSNEFSEFQTVQNKKDIEQWLDRMIDKQIALPAWKEQGIIQFMQGLDKDATTIEFSEQKFTQYKWFIDFVEKNITNKDLFQEMPNQSYQPTQQKAENLTDYV